MTSSSLNGSGISFPCSGNSANVFAVSYLVTLRINKGPPSLLNRRLSALHPGESITLGRVSKNQKTDFIAKSTNGYFDNPIISRHHAILRHDSRGVRPVTLASRLIFIRLWLLTNHRLMGLTSMEKNLSLSYHESLKTEIPLLWGVPLNSCPD